MRKTALLMTALIAFITLQAQWVNDPANNTYIANASADAGEIYLSTNENTGDTYVQWCCFGSNGWSPTLQRLNFEGVPQWGADGIHIGGCQFASYSEGIAMTTTADGGVVSCFADYEGYTYAVKIDADGNFVWGEQGLQLFDGQGFSRTELTAGTDGGFWALGSNYTNLFLQYVGPDGTLNPTVTISASLKCMFGQLTLSKNNKVFVTYEQLGNGFYTNKEIHLVGYATDGTQISDDVVLMTSLSFQSTYIHHVVSDGLGGGYAYIWHAGLGSAFNVYVFHFDEYGVSTIADPNGASVHSPDPANYYLDAYATVDPVSHDLIIAYQQTDAYTQSENRIYANRITAEGEKLWGEGILIMDNNGSNYQHLKVDAYEDGSGFVVIYDKTESAYTDNSVTEAKGYDIDGNEMWTTTLSSSSYNRFGCDNSTGFHNGQDIIIWTNATSGNLFGQNIQPNGAMGPIELPEPCLAPENFEGRYIYLEDSGTFGALLTWDAPETQPLWYQLYITLPDETIITAEVEPTETEFFHELSVETTITYRLIAVYEYCESDYALTPDGEDHVVVNITNIEENTNDEMISILRIFNANGQSLQCKSLDELGAGLYILQGLTQDGRLVSKKMVVNR